jgi:hypothetical protein
MDDNLVYVKFKRKLFKADLEKQLSTIIEDKIKALPNYTELKVHPELILLCCQLVENSIEDNKKLKVDKKELVINVMHKLFNYNPADKKTVEETIEFLWQTGKIHKVKAIKKIGRLVWDWFKRKFL